MEGSFEGFVTTHGGQLLRTALLLTGDRCEAEDLLQDVLERLYPRWNTVQDPQAYVRTAMSRSLTDRWRRSRRRPRQVPLAEQHDRAVCDGAADRAARADVVDRLRQLPPRQRAVIVLRYFEDWSEERIADELDVSRGTVKSQASKGLARLRELMARSSPVEQTGHGGDARRRREADHLVDTAAAVDAGGQPAEEPRGRRQRRGLDLRQEST